MKCSSVNKSHAKHIQDVSHSSAIQKSISKKHQQTISDHKNSPIPPHKCSPSDSNQSYKACFILTHSKDGPLNKYSCIHSYSPNHSHHPSSQIQSQMSMNHRRNHTYKKQSCRRKRNNPSIKISSKKMTILRVKESSVPLAPLTLSKPGKIQTSLQIHKNLTSNAYASSQPLSIDKSYNSIQLRQIFVSVGAF